MINLDYVHHYLNSSELTNTVLLASSAVTAVESLEVELILS